MNTKVKMYTLSTCSHCKSAKKFMQEHQIDFEFTDVDLYQGEERQKILEEVVKYNPDRSFPTILIGEKVIVGFRENAIKEALGI